MGRRVNQWGEDLELRWEGWTVSRGSMVCSETSRYWGVSSLRLFWTSILSPAAKHAYVRGLESRPYTKSYHTSFFSLACIRTVGPATYCVMWPC